MLKAIFFDRDGTLIDEPVTEIVNSWDKFHIKKGIKELKRLQTFGYTLFIISNQEAIGEGCLDTDFYQATNNELISSFKDAGVEIEKIYTCPHARSTNCICRKPARGLIDLALKEYQIDLVNSFIVGDRVTDVELSKKVGMMSIYIESSHHKLPSGLQPNFIAKGLSEVVLYIIGV
jgi:histidinol-phosphate phosphatase family protein